MADGFVANRITLDRVWDDSVLTLRYVVDDRPEAELSAELPALDRSAAQLVTAAAGIYLGSLCLAREVRLGAGTTPALLADLLPIAEMLYDIRRWRDGLPLSGPPQLDAAADAAPPRAVALEEQRALLLWSGGKDSTLGLLTLRANGYEARPLHATVNSGVEEPERAAVASLAPLLDVADVAELRVRHPEFRSLSRAYANAWDSFPLSNQVPFGRDLLLAALAVPVALREGAARISLGHDNECRNAEVIYEGKRIPRNDLESSRASLIFERALRRHVHPGLGLLPPVANIPELRILRDMLVDFPQLMERTSFCFWGRSCGLCGKCLRYYLAGRLYRPGLLRFEANPLARGACPELQDILNDPAVLFEREVMVLLGRLAERGDIGAEDEEIERFRVERLPAVAPYLDKWEAELLAEHPDPQVPPGFRPATALRALA